MAPASVLPSGATLLLEREAQVAALRAVLDAARSGEGAVCRHRGRRRGQQDPPARRGRAIAGSAGMRALTAGGGKFEGEFAYGIVVSGLDALTASERRVAQLAADGMSNQEIYVTLQIAAFVGISDQEAGLGAGLINTSQETGGALGLAVVATIAYSGINSKLAAAGHDASLIRQVHEAANHTAFLTAAVIGLVALLVAALLMPREKAGTSTHQPVDSSEADPTRSSSRSGDPLIAKEESA